MNTFTSHIRYATLGLFITLSLSGCNLFTAMHSDGKESNSHVLVADGKAAMQRGDYVKAAEYFRLGMEHNPKDSEARVGYAEAYLKAQGFSLGSFFDTLMNTMNSEDGDDIEFIVPEAWGVSAVSEVVTMLTTVIAVLDPIALGQTEGPYKATDLNVNLNAGVFYALKVAAQMQELGGNFAIQGLSKTDIPISGSDDWNLSQATLDKLQEDFLWIVDTSGSDPLQPALSFITGIQADISAAMQRLRVATANMENKDVAEMVAEMTRMFEDWETLAYQ